MPQLHNPYVRKLPGHLIPWTPLVFAVTKACVLALFLAPASLASPLDKPSPRDQLRQDGQDDGQDAQADSTPEALESAREVRGTLKAGGRSISAPPATPEGGSDKPEEADRHSFVDRRNVQKLIDSVSSTTRETSKNAREISSTLKTVLDLRLPLIDEKCDVNVSHELLRLGYAYYARTPGAEAELRGAADALVRKKDSEYRGVTARCRAALKGFGVAVLRVYLGSEWTADDDSRFERPSSRDTPAAAAAADKAAADSPAAPGEGPGPAKSGN